jgi:hypothetical protein
MNWLILIKFPAICLSFEKVSLWGIQHPVLFYKHHISCITVTMRFTAETNFAVRLPDPVTPSHKEFIHDLLTRFFKNLGSLKSAMRISGAFIGGSVALAALCKSTFDPQDLNFLVDQTGFDHLNYFLTESCGYKPVETDTYTPTYPPNWVLARFIRQSPGETLKIDMTYPAHPSIDPIGLLCQYHSSTVMNAITHYGMLSLFPELTLWQMNIVNKQASQCLFPCIRKYEQRGFTTATIGNHAVFIQDLGQPARKLLSFSTVSPYVKNWLVDW